jgi:O-antigen/teichoic acid export membrane protein
MRGARVAEPEGPRPGPGEARLLASGALLQQVAQGSGLVVLLVVVTLLARRLSVAELGAYGLVASLAGYLLVFRNSVASSAVRAMAAAPDGTERARMFSTAAALYAAVGLATGLLLAVVGLVLAGTILSGELASEARIGALILGAVTAVGISSTIYLDALRAERVFARAATVEVAGVLLHLAVMLTLILGGAGLGVVIGFSGGMPLMSGVLSAVVVRRTLPRLRLERQGVTRERAGEVVPTAGYLLVAELSNLVMYASGRVILGVFGTPRTIGLYEGPVRSHNLLYALGGALSVPTVPTASRYIAGDEARRLGELALRGSRYTLALFVPLCVILMTLAEPLLQVWLGGRYTDGAAALTILVSYWLLYGALVVTPGFLVGVGHARELARVLVGVAAANLALSLVLTPAVGVEGPALGTAIPFALAFPVLLRLALSAAGAQLRELARRAWLPAYTLGAGLAAALLALRAAVALDSLGEVAAAAAGGVLVYWAAFYALFLSPEERALLRGLTRGS